MSTNSLCIFIILLRLIFIHCSFRLTVVVTGGAVCSPITQVESTASEQFRPGRRDRKTDQGFSFLKWQLKNFPLMTWFSSVSPTHGSGQQCCYDSTGTLVLMGDSIGGSTPDRAHDWGSPPYKNPPWVPGYSHWLYDVTSFFYCCLWSDQCNIYFSHRPSSGCVNYRPPKAGEHSNKCKDCFKHVRLLKRA